MHREPCLDEDALAALVAGRVGSTERALLEPHLARCDDCRAILAELARDSVGAQPEDAPGDDRQHVGRFELLGVIGRGAMGTVYEAVDPQLQRKLAIKILHGSPRVRSSLPARMRDEGRALARLSHPNVVAVYDVGVDDESIYIAMELVTGSTLAAWLASSARSSTAILDVFTQAAEGLHAAHEVGLVHRDFKPSNVLVGDDGRVRVVDFGLSAPVDDDGHGDVVCGTPAYMPYEQLNGAPATPQSDQFAFCVALYEALYGRRPFEAATLEERRRALLRDDVPLPKRADVPRRIADVIRRGLSRDPQRRWPDMRALVTALTRRSPPVRSAVLLASVVVMTTLGLSSSRDTCDTQRDISLDIGDLGAAFERAAPGVGTANHAHVSAGLQAYARQWRDTWRTACARAGGRTTEDAGRYGQCLDEHRAEAEGAVAAMREPNRELVIGAPRLISTLPDPTSCLRLREDEAQPVDPSRAALRTDVARLRSMARASFDDAIVTELERLLERTRELNAPVEEAETLHILGVMASRRRDDAVATDFFTRSFHVGRAAGAAHTAAEAAVALVTLLGAQLEHHASALAWGRHAAAMLEALPEPELQSDLYGALAQAFLIAGKIDEAERLVRRGLMVLPDGISQWREASLRTKWGEIFRHREQEERAKEQLLQALHLHEAADGVDSPELMTVLNSLAVIHHVLGEHAEAQAVMNRAVDLGRRTWGEDDIALVYLRANLAVFAERRGDHEAALRNYLRVHDDFVRLQGRTGANVLRTEVNLATVNYALGRWPDVEDWARRAADHATEIGASPELLFIAKRKLAQSLRQQGRHDAAAAAWRALLTDRQRLAPQDERELGRTLGELAETQRRGGALRSALTDITRATELLERSGDPEDLATSYFIAAKIHHALGDEPRSIRLAHAAVVERGRIESEDDYAANARERNQLLAEIDAFAARGGWPDAPPRQAPARHRT